MKINAHLLSHLEVGGHQTKLRWKSSVENFKFFLNFKIVALDASWKKKKNYGFFIKKFVLEKKLFPFSLMVMVLDIT